MFASIGQSWQYAKMSYAVLWKNKQLLVFPLLSTLAAGLVLVSFAAPLWMSGQIEQWQAAADGPGGQAARVSMYVTLFCFYFCNYFVIVFFNSALIAAVMRAFNGEEPTVGEALGMAGRRIPQIVAWALVAAVVGVLLRAIENSNKRAGEIVAMVLGTAWTVMTYFVVPVIVMEGTGPVEAVKRSMSTLKSTWGTALMGNFSMGLLGFLLMLPIYLLAVVLIALGFGSGSVAVSVMCITAGVLLIAVGAATSSAANTVFTAALYSHATGRTVPADIDSSQFSQAFVSK